MANIGKTPTNVQWDIIQKKDCVVTMTMTSGGSAFDVSVYQFFLNARESKDATSTELFEITNSNIAQSDSGTGTTDTITVDITNSISDITPGKYYWELVAKNISSGDNDTWFQGVLNVIHSIQEVQ